MHTSEGTGMEHQVRSRDGRRLQVSEAGVPEGAAMLVHMGMPNSRCYTSRGSAWLSGKRSS
jgi:hypothetical protein